MKGHIEFPYATTVLKQTNLAARFCKIRSKGQVLNVLPNNWQLGHGDLYMKELLGRVPTIPIPIFNGIQIFRLASSLIQVILQMITSTGLT